MEQILIVDDDPGICEFMTDIISAMGYGAQSALTLKKGLDMAYSTPCEIIFLDVHMPDGSGLTAVTNFRKSPSSPAVIILTGDGTADGAVQAIESGAWDYMVKPATPDAIRWVLKHALELRQARVPSPSSTSFKREKIAGDSPELTQCLTVAADAAGNNANILITGESGTGKELFARAIHHNSDRAKKPFVVVDCAALPAPLVESVLFGHQKGAFTGASEARTGLIREADGGTLFLDELGELSASNQKRFLRVLQERRIRPIGGCREEAVDFRLIAATHRNIEAMAHEGSFREDLLFRLRGLSLALPPLRIRHGDTHIIAMRAIETCCHRFGFSDKGFYPEFLEALILYPWPGNARELIAAMEAAVIKAKSDPLLHPIHLPLHIRAELARTSVLKGSIQPDIAERGREDGTSLPAHAHHMSTAEQKYLRRVATAAGGNIREICRIANLSRAQVYRLIKKHGISI
ncbi:sigma-54 dependent transcriptional regulator [Desulfoluna sp.]|uniref:sigma-54-dependent transcriptional regulator n=1 Tax=Desulfoluna sp. TaxID=2045199 RepID=UPI0026236295|nr:sigma-54 dependent transcriptional regulator [Desulfoluna sp.]